MKWALSEPNPNSNSHTSYTDQKELKYLLKLWAIQVKNNQTPDTDALVQMPLYRYPDTDALVQMPWYRYPDTDALVQMPWYR